MSKQKNMENPVIVDLLIVEDNPHDAEFTVRTLKKQHLANNILIVEDGAEALDFIFNRGKYSGRAHIKPPRVIFLDLKIPKVNGLEVLREIKSNPATKKLPVVIISSSREEKDILSAYELDANSYVVKPVGFDEFFQSITKVGSYWLAINEPPK